MDVPDVLGTDELRSRLTGLLEEMASGGTDHVVVGRQRRPEAVLVSWSTWRRLTGGEPAGTVLGPARDLPSWDAREGLDFEVALDLLGDLIGWYSTEGYAEQGKPVPDPVRVAECDALVSRYAAERKALSIRDRAGVARAIGEYGPLVRRLYHPDHD